MIKHLLLCFLFLLVAGFPVTGQDFIYSSDEYGVSDGLSHREINAIYKDQDGFIWAAGKFGLNRFDGYSFQTWTKEKYDYPFDNIRTIFQDTEGWLWIITYDISGDIFTDHIGAIICLHPHSGEILSLEERFPDLPFNVEELSVTSQIDQEGTIYLFSYNDQFFFTYHPDEGFETRSTQGPPHLFIHCQDKDGNFWGTTKDSLFVLSPEGLLLHAVEALNVESVAPGADGLMWYNTQFSPGQYDQLLSLIVGEAPQPVAFFYSCNPNLIPSRWYFNEELQSLMFATLDDISFGRFNEFGPIPASITTIAAGMRSFLVDEANYWVGHDFGIQRIGLRLNRFQRHLSRDLNPEEARGFPDPEGLATRSVRGICVNDSILYAVGEFEGVFHLKIDTAENWQSGFVEGIGLRSSVNKGLEIGSQGELLIGNRGLYVFNPQSRELIDIERAPKLESHIVWDIYFLPDSNALLGTYDGLILFNQKERRIQEFSGYNTFQDLSKLTVLHIGPDLEGNLWICSNGGLYQMDLEKGIVAKHSREQEGPFYLPHSDIQHFYQDPEGVFWLATSGGGIIKWDRKNGSFEQFTQTEGLSNNNIYAIYPDDHGNLWLSSDWGIMQFNKESHHVNTFLPKDGISHFEFNRISHATAPDGTLFFGGLNGITSFHPDDFVSDVNRNTPPLVITSLWQFDGKTEQLVDRRGDFLSEGKIILKPADRYLEVRFSLLSYDETDKVRFAYQIEGLDSDWNYQPDPSVRLSRLPYGINTLVIKGQESNGNWSTNQLQIPIIVLRPFYLQWWFFAILLGTLIFGVTIYLRWRTKNLEQKKQRLEWEIARATERIELDKTTIEHQADELRNLDQLKSRFFANVSHELRTPLTLVMGPVNSLLKSGKFGPKETKMLHMASQNGKDLLKLVNEILDLSKLDSDRMEVKEEVVAFYPFIRRLVSTFESHAERNGLHFLFQYEAANSLNLELDVRKYEIIINNLLSNAIKFTPKGGRLTVRVEDQANRIVTAVTDTGRGIHTEDIPFVFDRYYQSKQKNAPTEGGTGIGLALSREYARLLGGDLSVESNWQEGSTFIVSIPKREVFGEPGKTPSVIPDALLHQKTDSIAKEISIQENTSTVLVVEDNLQMQEYLKILLQANYTVKLAENGLAAMDTLSQLEYAGKLPDLIISDIMMPEMDGFQLLTVLKSRDYFRSIPVVMLTARADVKDKLSALRIGVDDYLLKPFNEEELLIRVYNLLENYRNRSKAQLEDLKENADSQTPHAFSVSNEEQEWLEQLEHAVYEHLGDHALNLDRLAGYLFMSRRNLTRKIKQLTGITGNKYIQSVRLEEARRQLESGEATSVKALASAMGFKDAVYFSRLFRERYGKLPSEMVV